MYAFVIDISYLERLFAAQTPADVMIQLFASGGWAIFLIVLLWGLWKVWVESRQIRWLSQQQTTLLAIDVPKETEQTPKAVESVFSTIHGALSMFDRIEKYWIGKLQPVFSLEIVSIDGYVQFFVRTWVKFRDLVEASIYAQYPDAEITEVADYTMAAPKTFPTQGWDLFGTEFTLSNKNQYMIRTYPQFEHGLVGEFKDPIAALLEGLAKLKPGEQVWIQILIQPNDGKLWRVQGEALVKKLIKAKVAAKKTLASELVDFAKMTVDQVLTSPPAVPTRTKEEPPTMMLHLSPGERKVVEAVQEKLTKVAFNTKLRIVYVGKKEAFAKARTIAMLKGSFGQFTQLDQNGFRVYGKVTTKSDYPWQRRKEFEYLSLFMLRTLTTRQNSILRAYRNRSMGVGASPYILNIEELATIFHFPVIGVKTPLLKKAEVKRGEPPFTLPVYSSGAYPAPPPPAPRARRAFPIPPREVPEAPPRRPAPSPAGGVPENLPFV